MRQPSRSRADDPLRPSPSAARGPGSAPHQSRDLPSSSAARGSTADVPAGQGEAALAPVIRSKIQPPPVRSSTLSRPRLLDRLTECTANRLTLIVAEAGYGKTTLLADFSARSPDRMLWFKLDSTDADCVTWANYLVAAAREVEPTFGQGTMSLLSQMATGGPPKTVIIGTVVAELAALREAPTTLVLDDFHLVDESQDVADFVSRLLRDGPPWLHLVIATRRMPDLHLGRLAAMGEFAELGTDELRFSRSETEQLFANAYGQPLDADVLTDVDERTCGWAASLQLFYGSIRGRPTSAIRSLARSLSGSSSPIYDFLAEEVLGNLPRELEDFLTRCALLDRVLAGHVVALFADREPSVSVGEAQRLIEEADRLGLLTQSSQSSEMRQLHPLLRDFLLGHLARRYTPEQIRQMHLRLARAVTQTDPLTACQHYVAAGANAEAMALLGTSVMLTMGSGQWGIAAELIDKVDGVPLDPAVAAIRARSLMDHGRMAEAERTLRSIPLSQCAPDVRAAIRHSLLALGWRTGDRELMFSTLRDIQDDKATPQTFADIFQIFIDSSPLAAAPVTFAGLADRLTRMAAKQKAQGHSYFAAISLHNAALTLIAAGRFRDAISTGQQALSAFDAVPGLDAERYSTHAVLAIAALELGNDSKGEEHLAAALSPSVEAADVYAECAYSSAIIGDRNQAELLLARADELRLRGRADVPSELISTFARVLLALPRNAPESLERLGAARTEMPLDTGYDLDRQVLTILGHLLAGHSEVAVPLALRALETAAIKGARRSEARLKLLLAVSQGDMTSLRQALTQAAQVGDMALLTVADLLAEHLWMIPRGSSEIRTSISRWPLRWLPILRRQLEAGWSPNAAAAASLLDEFGERRDVPLLRAFAKTYGRLHKSAAGVGKALGRRLTPELVVRDLGQVRLQIEDRQLSLSSIRRKSAALLMFLVSRPSLAAGREQILEELWPESDPASAMNNLNQSLFYLRRQIDRWYGDDVAVEYVGLHSDVVSLEQSLVSVQSAAFVSHAQEVMTQTPGDATLELVHSYKGMFSPEFEYEEWAMSWRTRVHAHYLQLGNWAVDGFTAAGEHGMACEVALSVLGIDPGAHEIERKLIGLYWKLGHRSAAETQFAHLGAQERADGLVASRFRDLVSDDEPQIS